MKRRLLRSLLFSMPALLLYVVALPWLALRLDRWLGLVWHLPWWVEAIAGMALAGGGILAGWSFWLLSTQGQGTPNPLAPTVRLVETGPFRHSRNPLMLGGWLFGAGLGFLLRSGSLVALVGLVAISGMVYVRCMEERAMLARFGEDWNRYSSRTPRWICGCRF